MADVRQRTRSWLRLGLQTSALAVGASLGFIVAVQPRTAAADGILPTTVTIPTLPVTVPTVSLPITTTTSPVTTTTTTTTTTTPSSTTTVTTTSPGVAPTSTAGSTATGGAAGGTGATGPTGAEEATLSERTTAGVLHLAGGSISIPIKSVTAPNHLRVVVTLAPRVVKAPRPLIATIRVRDAQGNLVRGATVAIRSIPSGVLNPVGKKRSATDGRTTFVLHAKQKASGKGNRMWLLVTAADPARPKTVVVYHTVGIPIAVPSR